MSDHDRYLLLKMEVLEARQMLSTVQVFANGSEGDEAFNLVIDDQVVASYQLQGQPDVFSFESSDPISANQIKVQFTNDLYDEATETDRNLIVDKIVVDGETFETESRRTFATGYWDPVSQSIISGYVQSEWLHTDGYFAYADRSLIEVVTYGEMGTEEFELTVNGNLVGGGNVTTTTQSFLFEVDQPVDPKEDVVRVWFTNDLFDWDNGINRNLIVDKITVDDVTFESEAETTYSTGTWQGEGQSSKGFFSSEWLDQEGYLEYLAAADVTIRAAGDEGTEQIRLLVDQQEVAVFDLTQEVEQYTYRHFTKLKSTQLRVSFSGDQVDTANEFDTAVEIDWLEINDLRIESDSIDVYSSGVWSPLDQTIGAGFGRGGRLDVDGFVQFGFAPQDDTFSIPEDSFAVPLGIMQNDGLELNDQIEIVSSPVHGQLELVDGQWLYTPDREFVGSDSFEYRLGASPVTATVTLNVRQSHQQPQSQLNDQVADELTPSGKTLVVEKLARIPIDDNGRQRRMNSMTLLGDRMFVVTDGSVQGQGEIFEIMVGPNGQATTELFFDAGAAITAKTGLQIDNSSPLNGLRSLAFHPDFATNGKLYITYTGQRPADTSGYFYLSDPPVPVNVESVLAEFTFDFELGEIDVDSYREVFRVGMHNSEHSIRQAVFNPYATAGDEDYGLLYIGHGDGSEQSAISGDGLNFDALGKVLRIDPLQNGIATYRVPETNPFVGDPDMIDEAYAIGFRNPHNLTFFRAASGDVHLIVTEIGRDNVEEINLVLPGESYGWGDREGPFVHDPVSGTINGLTNLPADEAQNGYRFAAAIFGHEGEIGTSFVGQAIAGGHVISNGSTELNNQFVFVEFATDGRAYHVDVGQLLAQNTKLDPDDPENDAPVDLTWVTPSELTILFDHDNDDATTPLIRDSLKDVLDDDPDFQIITSAGKIRADLRLGQGPNGELLILNKRNGWIYLATNTVAPRASSEPVVVANDDLVSTTATTPVEINVLENDFGTGSEVTVISGPEHGTLVERGNGQFQYVPEDGFVGEDRFRYTVGAASQLLESPAGQARDEFGWAVDIDGDYAVISARLAEVGGQPMNTGAAHVFHRIDGVWDHVALLTPPDPSLSGPGDLFGTSVAIDGATIAIGSLRHDVQGVKDAGAVYVFQLASDDPGDWQLNRKLTLETVGVSDRFGYSLDLDADTLVVGAFLDDDPNRPGTNHGSVSIFERHDGGADNWGRVTTFFNSDPVGAGDHFGKSVSIDGDLLVVGSPRQGRDNFGNVYAYQRHVGGVNAWGEIARIDNPDPQVRDEFGLNVSLQDGWLAVGSPLDDVDQSADDSTSGINAGSVTLYRFDAHQREFQFVDQLFSQANEDVIDGEDNDQFGAAVAIGHGRLVVGAPWTNAGLGGAGLVYQYQLDESQVVLQKTIQPQQVRSGYRLGSSVAISGDDFVLAAPQATSSDGQVKQGWVVVGNQLEDAAKVTISVQ